MGEDIPNQTGWYIKVKSGYLKNTVKDQALRLVSDFKHGKEVLVGSNKYQNPDTKDKKVLVVGEDGFREELRTAGVKMINDEIQEDLE